jgi:NAD(P)-dependent dehydrogenase (short-subunit alcohol dehydrogenase family)
VAFSSATFFSLFYAKSRLTLFYTAAMELADYNIRVNAVSPAVVNTTLYHGVLAEKKRKGTDLWLSSNR